ncbi:ATP-binding protein [Actinocorallia longicatena]|uniref:AAA family ATPase n=1 Tax=Actinocorallia longicatena TaxID=111803 RepID=A0ABP6QFJ8_9ACTN
MAEIGTDDARQLAGALRQVLEAAHRALGGEGRPSALVEKVTGHLGVPPAEMLAVSQSFPPWEHVNLQRGVDAYLTEPGWFGMSGHGLDHEDFLNILTNAARHGMFELGRARFGTAPTGPATSTEVVELGLVHAVSPGGEAVVIGLRTAGEFSPSCRIDVLAASGRAATETRDEIVRLMRVHDVFRGQVLSFGVSEHHGNELVTFLPRPPVRAADVILPDGVLDLIERHVVEVAEWSAELLAAGQHLKRGLLLHGPPGTGKTHTVRYLISSLAHCTVILLTGPAMRFIDEAAALARRLQPSLVVLEDVDLVATDRDLDGEDGRPLLFSLLDAMDGVGGDADVSFVLTTNRASVLEKALAERPGRVDLAVEIPRPDAAGRARLLALYGRGVDVQADPGPVVEATEGVTASYVKELVRRAVLAALRESGTTVLHDRHFAAAGAEMDHGGRQLTRVLLGADPGDSFDEDWDDED